MASLAALGGMLAVSFGADMLKTLFGANLQLQNAEQLMQFKQQAGTNAGLPPQIAALNAFGSGSGGTGDQLGMQYQGHMLEQMTSAVMMGTAHVQGIMPWLQGTSFATPSVPVSGNYGGMRVSSQASNMFNNMSNNVPPTPELTEQGRLTGFTNLGNTTNLVQNQVTYVPSSQGTLSQEIPALSSGSPETLTKNPLPTIEEYTSQLSGTIPSQPAPGVSSNVLSPDQLQGISGVPIDAPTTIDDSWGGQMDAADLAI